MKTFIVLVGLVAATTCFSVPLESQLLGQWELFKVQHEKIYPSEQEEAFRIKVFKDNAIKVLEHNARFERGEVTFKVALNRFSDLLTHEVAERFTGLHLDALKTADRVHNATTFVADDWASIDWRSRGFVTPVKDQGPCGSCWAFSATGAIEGQIFKKTGNLVSLSEQNLVDCDTVSQGCNGGYVSTAFMYVKSNGGIATEASYPYEAKAGSCRYNQDNRAGTVSSFVGIKATEEDLHEAVSSVGPVSVLFDASNWSFHHYSSGIYFEPACSGNVNHAMLAVGYGSDGPDQDFWIVKNSWGTVWGEQGYFKAARNRGNNCAVASWACYPVVE